MRRSLPGRCKRFRRIKRCELSITERRAGLKVFGDVRGGETSRWQAECLDDTGGVSLRGCTESCAGPQRRHRTRSRVTQVVSGSSRGFGEDIGAP